MVINGTVGSTVVNRQYIFIYDVKHRVCTIFVELNRIGDILSQNWLDKCHDPVNDGRSVSDVVDDEPHRSSFLKELRIRKEGFDVGRDVEELLKSEANHIKQEDFAFDKPTIVIVHCIVGIKHHKRGLNHIDRTVYACIAFMETNYRDFVFFLRQFPKWAKLAVE